MHKFRTRLVIAFIILVLFTSLSYLTFLLHLSSDILKVEAIDQLHSIILVWGLAITVLAAIGAVLISLFLARGVTKPISKLVEATGAISKRNFNQNIKIRGYSEIEELGFSFKHMTQQLKNFQQESERHIRNLEKIAKERAKELSCIYRIGREVSSSLDLSEVLDTIVRRITEVLNLKICTILLVDETTADSLKILRTEGISLKRIEKEAIKQGKGISGWVWDKKEALLIKDVNQDNRFIGREKEKYYTGSLISVPLEAKNRIIGVINANNKVNGEPFGESDLLLLKEIATESAIAIENALLYKSLKEVYLHTISALVRALETKDHYTKSHSEYVTRYAVAIAEEMGLSAAQIEIIRQACQLHDLGKIGIHDYILTKPGKLTSEEWDEVRLHSLKGAEILQPIEFLSEVANLIRQHHERYDGKGYPTKLCGQDIQVGARIMAIADAFDAMISERPYRKALGLSRTIAELKANSATQFDPEIVKIFLKLLETKLDLVKHK